jgi:glycosyltransferase involved in cell wall biosynthesis
VIDEAATIDILYVAFNRKAMTQASFEALVENTAWEQVRNLYVVDDGSEDGTAEWLLEQQLEWMHKIRPQYGCDFIFWGEKIGGPVAAINWYVDNSDDEIETFAKIDNDFVVCPGWLDVSLRLHFLDPNIDIIGFEPMSGRPQQVTETNHAEWRLNEARHIGGKGLIRKRAFERSGCRPYPHGERGYQGFTQWQRKHEVVQKAWISPDLCCFGLDQLPFDPWRALTTEYVENGWQRRWSEYDELDTTYWQWWVDQDPARIAA